MTSLPRFYARLVRRHPIACVVIAGVVLTIVAAAIRHSELRQAATYLSAVTIGVVLIDVISLRRRSLPPPIPVRAPRLESLALIVCWAIAAAWLTGRFVFNYLGHPPLFKLVWAVIGLGCVFNAIPALFFLFVRRYWPADLGVRVTGLLTALPVLAVFAAATLLFSRGSITLWEVSRTETTMGIVMIALSASVPEEFFRIAWQTRLGAWTRSPAAGWMIASVVWSALHAPKVFSEVHSVGATATYCIGIVPLGLLWGYLTHRTQSFLPSVVLHGMNFWGLQNL